MQPAALPLCHHPGMNLEEFLQQMAQGRRVVGGSATHQFMHRASQEAFRITSILNGSYHEPARMLELLGELTGREVPDSVGLFPPFHTEFGKNIRLGHDVFINMGCMFQDTGGITIGDGSLIGHRATLTTLNHDPDPAHRADMVPAPIHIGSKVWLGANVTVIPGITIGDGAIVGAGSVVTKDVPPGAVVAGVPARTLRQG